MVGRGGRWRCLAPIGLAWLLPAKVRWVCLRLAAQPSTLPYPNPATAGCEDDNAVVQWLVMKHKVRGTCFSSIAGWRWHGMTHALRCGMPLAQAAPRPMAMQHTFGASNQQHFVQAEQLPFHAMSCHAVQVCIIPGSSCGRPGHVRAAFANLK